MADLRKIFTEEAAEILAELEPKILEMEESSSPQLLNDIFRLAHTLKGSAAIAGVSGVGSLAHHLEDLLEMVRDGEVEAEEGLVDLLLVACDTLKAMVLELEEGADAQPPQELLEQLSGYAGRRQARPSKGKPDAAGNSATAEAAGVEKTYRLTLAFGRDFFKRGHNLEYLLEDLAQLGRIDKIAVDAGRVPPLTELDPEDYWLVWEVTLTTSASKAEIEDVFAFVLDEESRLLVQSSQNSGAYWDLPPIGPAIEPLPAAVREEVSLAGEKPTPKTPHSALQASFRVSRDTADALLGLAGELIITKNSLPYLAKKIEAAGLSELARELNERYHYLDRIAREIQERLMDIWLLPVGEVFGRFPRYVRDQAKKLGKLVELKIRGEETRLDRSIIEEIYEPLLHLVRNSLDHGLESPVERESAGKEPTGVIRLEAWRHGERVLIQVADDGRGIDTEALCQKAVAAGLIGEEQISAMGEEEKLRLVFLPGLSQKEDVSDLSGRGVGMDAVENAVRRLGGSVSLKSVPGQGTQVTLNLPFTAATTEVLLVEVCGAAYGLPLSAVKETVRMEENDFKTLRGRPVALLRGEVIPIVQLFYKPDRPASKLEGVLVVLHQRAGILVERVAGREEVVVKPLPGELKKLPAYLGAAVLGDGRVLLILDPAELVVRALLDY